MAMSDRRILEAMNEGRIVIQPFRREHLCTSSYDVCIGENFYREQAPRFPGGIYNIYDRESVKRVWGDACRAQPALEILQEIPNLGGFRPDDPVILLHPGETILAHTEEFIGGRVDITTMMKARSSMGRSFLLVCKCLHPNTLVRMANGTEKRIAEIRAGDYVINADRKGKTRYARVRAVRTAREYKRTVEFQTQSGRSVYMSEDHICRVSAPDGDTLLCACDVRVGDALPVMRQAPVNDHSDMGVDEASLLGYVVAEGNWQKYRLSIAKDCMKVEQRDEIRKLMRSIFPDAPEAKEYPTQFGYNSVDFCAQFQRQYPEVCRLAPFKRIPPSLLHACPTTVRAFMRTYLACDGSMRRDKDSPSVEMTTRSEGLLRDLVYLASKLGCAPTSIYERYGSTGQACACAAFYGNDANSLGHPNRAKVDRSWPVEVPSLMHAIRTKYNLTRKQLQGYATTDGKSISRSKLVHIYDYLTHYNWGDELAPYVHDIVWDPIVHITRPPIQMSGFVDISLDVESEHDSAFALASGIMVPNCAGWGDVGYINRWTMEVTNVSRHYSIPLLAGERVAQIVFLHTGAIVDKEYGDTGNYQTSTSVDEVVRAWTPANMLPRLKRRSHE